MSQNSAKEQIKGQLELAGFRICTHNIELVYQRYLGAGNSIGSVIKEVKQYLKR